MHPPLHYIQDQYGGQGQVNEAIMNDIHTRKQREKKVRDIASTIYSIIDSVYGSDREVLLKVIIDALCSWPTAFYPDKRSSKIDATELLTPHWKDTIDVVLHKNPKTMDEAYGKAATNFTPEQRARAKKVMQSRFDRLSVLQDRGQLLFCDNNGRTCYPDRNKLINELENDFGFQRRLDALDLTVLTNTASRAVNILHGPLCIAGDARNVITTEQAVRRGMTLAVMELVTIATLRLPRLSAAMKKRSRSDPTVQLALHSTMDDPLFFHRW